MRFEKKSLAFFVFAAILEAVYTRGSHAEGVLNSLEREEWPDDEEPCRTATLAWLRGVHNHTTWATWIWDSMQLPVGALYGSRYHLGNFDQCLGEVPWVGSRPMDTQYCVAEVTLASETRPNELVDPYGTVQDFVQIRTKYSRRLNHYFFGVCLPRVCSPSSVARVSRHLHQLSHLPFGDVRVPPSNCQFREERPKSFGFYAFWCIIIMLSVIATAVYLVDEISIKNPFLSNLANWFSPSKNFKALTYTTEDEMTSLNGLRCVCAGAVTSMHYFMYSFTWISNPGDVGKHLGETWLGTFLVQLALVVDVFFVLSGILHMKGMLVSKSGLGKMLVKRYLRLLPTLALSLLFMSEVLPHTTSGPLYPKMIQEQVDTCRNWWTNVLMINNYVKTDQICHVVTWYLSCDYQLTILGTVIFYLSQIFRRKIMVMLCSGIFLVSLISQGILAYWHEIPPILIYDVETAGIVEQNRVFHTTYTKSHTRASTYLIGLVMGYLTHVYKPKDYRHTISKNWSIAGAILGLCILLSALGVGSSVRGALASSLYIALDKSVFALGICLIIVVCEYGHCPIVGDFFTSKLFLPLSRLSYGMYLYHSAIIVSNTYSSRTSMNYQFFPMFVNGFGYIVVAALLSYLLWFIVEAPAANIVNYSFQTGKKKTKLVVKQSTTEKSNKTD